MTRSAKMTGDRRQLAMHHEAIDAATD